MRGMSEGVDCEGLCSVCMNNVDNAYRTLRYRECGGSCRKEGKVEPESETEYTVGAKQGKEHSILFY